MDVFATLVQDRNPFPDGSNNPLEVTYEIRNADVRTDADHAPAPGDDSLTSSQKIVAWVPFEFVVGNKIVRSGEWIIQPATMNAEILVIRNTATAVGLFSNASVLAPRKPLIADALVFHKYGKSYFLSGVKIAVTRTSYRLPESKGETEMRVQNLPATEEVLLAALK